LIRIAYEPSGKNGRIIETPPHGETATV